MTATADLLHTVIVGDKPPKGRHAAPTVSVICDAHTYPFDGKQTAGGDPGELNPSLVEIAERFGVMVEDVTAELWGDRPFCWEYRFTGPRDNVRRAIAEYWDEWAAAEYLGEPPPDGL